METCVRCNRTLSREHFWDMRVKQTASSINDPRSYTLQCDRCKRSPERRPLVSSYEDDDIESSDNSESSDDGFVVSDDFIEYDSDASESDNSDSDSDSEDNCHHKNKRRCLVTSDDDSDEDESEW